MSETDGRRSLSKHNFIAVNVHRKGGETKETYTHFGFLSSPRRTTAAVRVLSEGAIRATTGRALLVDPVLIRAGRDAVEHLLGVVVVTREIGGGVTLGFAA